MYRVLIQCRDAARRARRFSMGKVKKKKNLDSALLEAPREARKTAYISDWQCSTYPIKQDGNSSQPLSKYAGCHCTNVPHKVGNLRPKMQQSRQH